MNTNTLAILLGAVLLLVGIMGSVMKRKDKKTGKAGRAIRVLSMSLGLLLIIFGLWMADKLPIRPVDMKDWGTGNRLSAGSNRTGTVTAKKGDRGLQSIENGFEKASTVRFMWNKGESIGGKAGQNGFQKVFIDENAGAENSRQSLVMEFKFGTQRTTKYKNEKIKARIKYRINRDLSDFEGIRFHIKSDQTMKVLFYLVEKDIKSINWNRWIYELEITDQWKAVVIPFERLQKAGDRDTRWTLDLKNTDSLVWLVNERMVPPGSHGKIWLDQVSLY